MIHYLLFSWITTIKKCCNELINSKRVVSDPVVTDLRVIEYCPRDIILYNINYNNTFNELPRKLNIIKSEYIIMIPKLYNNPYKLYNYI